MNELEIKKAFEEYEELKLIAKDANKKIEKLKPIVQENVPEDSEVIGQHGKFFLQSRPRWKYSDQIKKMEEELKAKKKDEEAKGIAEMIDQKILVYKENDDTIE